ncbi:MAG: hypothetical protein ACI4O9_06640 [Akkermansia sp.]
MDTEENKTTTTAPVPDPAPTADACDRLQAARQFAEQQYEKLRHATADQMESVLNYTEQARKQLNEGWNVTCDKARELHKAGEAYVKENPTSTVMGALGVGVILGLLLGGRR